MTHPKNPILEELKRIAFEDTIYCQPYDTVNVDWKRVPMNLRDYWRIRDSLSMDDGLVLHGSRLVIPTAARRTVLARLHDSHSGIEATKRRPHQIVWWPGITSDIINTVQSCNKCQTLLPFQVKEPMMSESTPTKPFEDVSADIFSHAGKDF